MDRNKQKEIANLIYGKLTIYFAKYDYFSIVHSFKTGYHHEEVLNFDIYGKKNNKYCVQYNLESLTTDMFSKIRDEFASIYKSKFKRDNGA